MNEQMNRAHALITSSPPKNGTQYILMQHCIAPREPTSLLTCTEEPHLAISSVAGLNITLDISPPALLRSHVHHVSLHLTLLLT